MQIQSISTQHNTNLVASTQSSSLPLPFPIPSIHSSASVLFLYALPPPLELIFTYQMDPRDRRADFPTAAAASTAPDDANMMHRLNPSNPLRLVINGGSRVVTPAPLNSSIPPPPSSSSPPPPPLQLQRQSQSVSLNSRNYTNKISLALFAIHILAAAALICFLVYKAIDGLVNAGGKTRRREERVLRHFLPQVEAASLLSITLAFIWQKAFRTWPRLMIYVILWTSFGMSLSAGVILICFQTPSTDGVGVCLIAFAIGNGLYACWVTQRIGFSTKVLIKSLEPLAKFPDLNHPTYWLLVAGFCWMSLWIMAVIGALNFYFPPLVIIGLVLSLMWTAEVMRNVANLTVSRVIALYYLRGMQSSTNICFQRALTRNLGSACLGSLFVPAIEALRILARGLNLLEGEDEFMFSCAHCCLNVMNSIFSYGNSWAFVQIASYGKGFVQASQDTWELFRIRKMETLVDSDITSSICFLTGVSSGSICLIAVAVWTFVVHKSFTATISLLSFFVGYLMTRIAMALPHACVSCYYVCYSESETPDTRLYDNIIPERLERIEAGRDVIAPTPRVPRQFA